MVTPTCAAGTPPVQTGGNIADGTYVLTSATNYACGDAGNTLPPAAATAQIAGGCLDFVITEAVGDAGTITSTASETVSFSGTSITTVPQCPQQLDAGTVGETYTATGTTFTYLSSTGTLQVYTKM